MPWKVKKKKTEMILRDAEGRETPHWDSSRDRDSKEKDSEVRDSESRDSESRDSEARGSESGQIQGPLYSDTP